MRESDLSFLERGTLCKSSPKLNTARRNEPLTRNTKLLRLEHLSCPPAIMIPKMATCETAENKYITIDSTKFAHCRFGTRTGVPLCLHIQFRGARDHWDPTFINPLAATRPILLLDNSGVGRSEGAIPRPLPAGHRSSLTY
ncbi:hypothetical protein DPSP01_009277 [Paraphaeosphaeria sporulosa]|uniref:AB hydrolase-1 domain-containing protein n=1 Tax=Paraphaeosphaeria sporulosa TaxID=1460663 RepID=A0A177BZG5_9PLEO|nr:uncharacterized protein CC84DRAFT_245611 [Paraphaeosphaeria sporulosa]OAG00773.1 hypothetical protein CC84DRAFT_245611 [Paraphaeosphaeria sporulosa]